MDKSLYIVIPCYNEQEVLPITAPMFLDKINSLIQQGLCNEKSRVLFVNDGSKDDTWNIIQQLAEKHEKIAHLASQGAFGLSITICPFGKSALFL